MKRLKWENIIPIIIPLAILLYVLYWNFLPFGYDQTFVLDVGTDSDTDCSNPICITDLGGLGPIQRDGSLSWRSFKNDSSIKIKINYPLFSSDKIFVKPEFSVSNGIENLYYSENNSNNDQWSLWIGELTSYQYLGLYPKNNFISTPYELYVNPNYLFQFCDYNYPLNSYRNISEYKVNLRGKNQILAYFSDGIYIDLGSNKGDIFKGNVKIESFSGVFNNTNLSGYFLIMLDGEIENLKLSTNKFIFLDSINNSNWNAYFTQTSESNNLYLNSDIDQKISFSNIPVVELKSDVISNLDLPFGTYTLQIEKGNIFIQGADFSISEEYFFNKKDYFACQNQILGKISHFDISDIDFYDVKTLIYGEDTFLNSIDIEDYHFVVQPSIFLDKIKGEERNLYNISVRLIYEI